MQIKNKIKSLVKTFLMKKGLKTNKKIVVFESDDWGADRNYSKENLDKLLSLYPEFAPDGYQKFDTLESDEDVRELKKVLLSCRGADNSPAVFTLNFATFNLNTEEMKNADLKETKLVPIELYYKEKNGSGKVLAEVADGEYKGCFASELHSREHINSETLIADIKGGNKLVADALDLKIVGVNSENYCGMDTLNTSEENSKAILEDAMEEYEKVFGKVSESYIAPCYTWKPSDEKVLENLGVKYLQGKLFQNLPVGKDKYKKVYHKFGEKSKNANLYYFYRNCFFEPTRDRLKGKSDDEILKKTMQEIKLAFRCKKPAVICSHRVNFVSGIAKENRTSNLKLLKELLEKIKQEYPDVIFESSAKMCKEILAENDSKKV